VLTAVVATHGRWGFWKGYHRLRLEVKAPADVYSAPDAPPVSATCRRGGGTRQRGRGVDAGCVEGTECLYSTEEVAPMHVAERRVDAVTIVDVTGRLALGEAAEALHDKVRSLLQQGHRQIVINLGGVSYMDSCGLGTLVSALATASRAGGALTLLNLTERLENLLVISRLLNVFECFDDEASAIARFGSGGTAAS
jgi:anti-sigma B factor antagonist